MITMSSMLKFEGVRIRSIIAAALLLALAGCGPLRLVYSQADLLIYRWLNGYVDFNGQQAPRAREAIARWLAWHRTTQLRDYAELLQRAAAEVKEDTTGERLCRWVDEVQTRADRGVEQALPEAAALARRLTPEQLEHIAQRQRKAAQKLHEEFLEPDPAARLERQIERATDRAEQLYGRLDAPQRERLAQGVSTSPFDADRWVAERERRQRDLLDTLRELRALPVAAAPGVDARGTALLQAWWQRVRQSPDAAYRGYAERLQPYNCELAARLHNATTPAQRETARRRLQDWRGDLLRMARPD
jgi:hypothetical protein